MRRGRGGRGGCAYTDPHDFVNADYLAATSFTQVLPLTVHLTQQQLLASSIEALPGILFGEYIGCAKRLIGKGGSLGDCAWVVAELAAPVVVKAGARAAVAMRTAMRTGSGFAKAIEGLRGLDLDVTAMGRLKASVNGALKSCDVAPHSFAGSTRVVMADGSRRPISGIAVGDIVRATDADTGALVTGVVSRRLVHYDGDLTDVIVLDGAGNRSVIHTTSHHPFWDASRHAWMGAAVLHVGDHLRSLDGRSVIVAGVRSATGEQVTYDLSVEAAHTYYVGVRLSQSDLAWGLGNKIKLVVSVEAIALVFLA